MNKKILLERLEKCESRIYNLEIINKDQKEQFLNHKKQIFDLQEEIWKLNNPFKFKLGDVVKRIITNKRININLNTPLNITEDKIYKIISCMFQTRGFGYYNGYSYKTYEIFCCDTNEKFIVNEDELEFVKKDKK